MGKVVQQTRSGVDCGGARNFGVDIEAKMNIQTWIVQTETLTDHSNVFNVVSYHLGSTVSLPCENWKKATDLAELLNCEAPTVYIDCYHGE